MQESSIVAEENCKNNSNSRSFQDSEILKIIESWLTDSNHTYEKLFDISDSVIIDCYLKCLLELSKQLLRKIIKLPPSNTPGSSLKDLCVRKIAGLIAGDSPVEQVYSVLDLIVEGLGNKVRSFYLLDSNVVITEYFNSNVNLLLLSFKYLSLYDSGEFKKLNEHFFTIMCNLDEIIDNQTSRETIMLAEEMKCLLEKIHYQ
ncbi:MAG: hypothetical protein ACFFD4_37870 [Candidatus Odinarchaeota archaeon]